MSETRESTEKVVRRRPRSLFWPLLLIGAGILFLLDNLGYANINAWQLWRLWPVLIILAGLDLLLARRSWLGNLVVLLVSLLVIGAAVWLVVGGPRVLTGDDRGGAGAMTLSEPIGDAERASLDLDFPAGTLQVDSRAGVGSLVEGALDLAGRRQPDWSLTRNGGQATARLAYSDGQAPSAFNWGRGEEWRLHLAPQVTWDVTAKMGAGQARLDLTGLNVGSVSVDAGAAETTVILPGQGNLKVSLKSGVGALVVQVPATLAVRLRANRGLAGLDLPDRYQKSGDVYVAGNWDSADNRVELDLDLGVGAITISEP